ncbi:MAG: sugar kinase [Epulopiscium sp. Nuni2H_MBin001]|nr:MAG: sugar kinase [Epulopiscium sp. Nuni2H_MBin001]
MQKKFDLLSLGEILLRLSPPRNERMSRGSEFDKKVGGAELNVVSGVAQLGLRTGMISKVPAHDMGQFAKNRIRFVGVSDDLLLYDEGKDARLGIYYYENGAYPRKPKICYDRQNTSMLQIQADEWPDEMYSLTKCFHTTGITLALSQNCRRAAIDMIKRFKEQGTLISFDVNFRSNLWTGDEARDCIVEILPYVDVFFCSEDTARLTFNKTGDITNILKSFADEYDIGVIAATQRIVHTPKIHTFGSLMYEKSSGNFYREEPYRNIDVVDRIGSGDAYISGALYGLLKYDMDCEKALEFGDACGAIKNTIPGDMQASTSEEVEAIIASHKNVGRDFEMVR